MIKLLLLSLFSSQSYAFDYFQGMQDSMMGRLTINSIIYTEMTKESSNSGDSNCACPTERPLSKKAWERIKAKEEQAARNVEEFQTSPLGKILSPSVGLSPVIETYIPEE